MNLDDILSKLDSKGIKLPSGALHKINRIIKSDHISDFNLNQFTDPIEYINNRFPDLESLNEIDDEIIKIENESLNTQKDIEKHLQTFSANPDFCAGKLDDTLSILKSLVDKIESLNIQAKASENTVLHVTKDIKQLVNAKKNLSCSISVLNHLKMVSTGLNDIREQLNNENFKAISEILPKLVATEEILSQYTGISHVDSTMTEYLNVKEEVKNKLIDKFTKSCFIVFDEILQVDPRLMNCITSIGKRIYCIKDELILIFLDYILKEYKEDFLDNEENCWLDHLDLRFSWLKRQLVTYDEIYNLWFPYSWEVDKHFILKFCELTTKNIVEVMEKRKIEIDNKILLASIQKSIIFEDFLNKRFECAATDLKFEGLIVNPFQKYIFIYVEFQEMNLKTMIHDFVSNFEKSGLLVFYDSFQARDLNSEDKIMRLADTPTDNANISLILPAAGEIFLYYKRCLIQLSKMRNIRCIESIIQIFKRYLDIFYNKILFAAILHLNAQISKNKGSSEMMIKACCCVVATSGYCSDTVEQLEIKIRQITGEIVSPDLSFVDIKKSFDDLILNGISCLVQALEIACQPGFSSHSQINWSIFDEVGDLSSYVTIFDSVFNDYIPMIRNFLYLSEKYFDIFCINFAEFFISKYLTDIFSTNSITSPGIQQHLLDIQLLKKLLQDSPSIGSDGYKPSKEFIELVKTKMKNLEMMLKLVLTPHRPFDQFVDQYFNLVNPSDFEHFKFILTLKALNKKETKLLIESFNMVINSKQNY